MVRRKALVGDLADDLQWLGRVLLVAYGAGVVVVDLFGDAAHAVDGELAVVFALEGADFSSDFA